MRCVSKSYAIVVVFVGISLLLLNGITSSACAGGDSPWMVKMRLLGVAPDVDSSTITLIGGEGDVDDSITVDLDFVYFFTDNVAAELTATFTNHDVEAENTAIGDVDLGDVWLLPPCLTLQYHFLPEGAFHPYIGAGINYTIFFGEDEGDVDSIDYDDSIGFVLQAGFDYFFNDNWAITFDLKKVFLDTEVTVDALGLQPNADVDIDPWLIGVGFAYRF